MRVGIVTFQRAQNFGSALQVYALQQTLVRQGHQVEVIDYRGKDDRTYRLLRLSRPKTMFGLLVNLRRNFLRSRRFKEFRRDHINLTEESYSWRKPRKLLNLQQKFDAFICGSDQIWNLDCTAGPVGAYFLSFAGPRTRIAYGPSLAHTQFAEENFDRDEVRRLLSSFSCISVREANTIPLFQPLALVPFSVVVDPTLLIESDRWNDLSSSVAIRRGDYLFVYMLEYSAMLVESAKCLSDRLGIRIVYVSSDPVRFSRSAENVLGIGPLDFLSWIRGAKMVMTNSFHATVFSLLFGVPFRAFAPQRSSSRIAELLRELGMSERLALRVDSSAPLPFTSADVERSIERVRGASMAYLEAALSDGTK